jgi:hypothetical protein
MLDTERQALDLSGVEAAIKQLADRIERLETNSVETSHSALRIENSHHPSLDKLAIAEAIADQIFGGEGKEKACTFEPNGKPCDHCSMCNSRGF